MENSVDDIIIKAAVAVDRVYSWLGEEAEGFQVVPRAEDDAYLRSVKCSKLRGLGRTMDAVETACCMLELMILYRGRWTLPCMPNRIPNCWNRSGVIRPDATVTSLLSRY